MQWLHFGLAQPLSARSKSVENGGFSSLGSGRKELSDYEVRRELPRNKNKNETAPSAWIPTAASSLFRRWRILGGSASAKAALHFGLDVAAQRFRNDAGGSEFAEVGNGELWQVGQNGGERR